MVAHKKQGIPGHARSWIMYLLIAIALVAFFYTARQVMLNVWLTLVLAACLVVATLLTQLANAKKLFTRLQS
jgi:small-conductance mechanosensitive channel